MPKKNSGKGAHLCLQVFSIDQLSSSPKNIWAILIGQKQNDNCDYMADSFSAAEQCDWPEQSLCQFDPGAVKAKPLPEKTYLYLTFDDGPNEGTTFVLDALASQNVPATFFINR